MKLNISCFVKQWKMVHQVILFVISVVLMPCEKLSVCVSGKYSKYGAGGWSSEGSSFPVTHEDRVHNLAAEYTSCFAHWLKKIPLISGVDWIYRRLVSTLSFNRIHTTITVRGGMNTSRFSKLQQLWFFTCKAVHTWLHATPVPPACRSATFTLSHGCFFYSRMYKSICVSMFWEWSLIDQLQHAVETRHQKQF